VHVEKKPEAFSPKFVLSSSMAMVVHSSVFLKQSFLGLFDIEGSMQDLRLLVVLNNSRAPSALGFAQKITI
jgi:hypothetical protein